MAKIKTKIIRDGVIPYVYNKMQSEPRNSEIIRSVMSRFPIDKILHSDSKDTQREFLDLLISGMRTTYNMTLNKREV